MIVWTAVFAVVMAVLTFLDLPIAKSVYHYSDLYGNIFQIAGIIPTCVAGTDANSSGKGSVTIKLKKE